MREGQPIDFTAYKDRKQISYPIPTKSIDNSKDNITREVVGSKAFNLEYFSYTTRTEMYEDIVSYLGEYRFQLDKFDYEMVYAQGTDGNWAIRDTARGESLRTKSERVLKEREYRGDTTLRETHEDKGIEKLDEVLKTAEDGDKLRWMSPPGDSAEGYGTYGFLYEGDIEKKVDGSLMLHMSAIRLEGELEDYNKAFSMLTGVDTAHTKAESFLSDPKLVKGEVAKISSEDVLKETFGFEMDVTQKEIFAEVVGRVDDLIHEVIEEIKTGNQYEKVRAFNTLENYFIKQKQIVEEERKSGGSVVYMESFKKPTLQDLQAKYGHEAPVAKGSCGAAGQSSNLTIGGGNQIDNFLKSDPLKKVGIGDEDYDFDEVGNCRVCGKEGVNVGPCAICQPCDSKMQVEQLMNPMKDAV